MNIANGGRRAQRNMRASPASTRASATPAWRRLRAFALTAWLVLGAGASRLAVRRADCGVRRARRLARSRPSRARPRRPRRHVLRTRHRTTRRHDGRTSANRARVFSREDHLYTRDLDIFGPASLFQLLSRARTQLGEELLARWLSAPAGVPTVRQRQESIAELREALDFREALATAGGASRDIDTDRAQRMGVGAGSARERLASNGRHRARGRHRRRDCVVGTRRAAVAPAGRASSSR